MFSFDAAKAKTEPPTPLFIKDEQQREQTKEVENDASGSIKLSRLSTITKKASAEVRPDVLIKDNFARVLAVQMRALSDTF